MLQSNLIGAKEYTQLFTYNPFTRFTEIIKENTLDRTVVIRQLQNIAATCLFVSLHDKAFTDKALQDIVNRGYQILTQRNGALPWLDSLYLAWASTHTRSHDERYPRSFYQVFIEATQLTALNLELYQSLQTILQPYYDREYQKATSTAYYYGEDCFGFSLEGEDSPDKFPNLYLEFWARVTYFISVLKDSISFDKYQDTVNLAIKFTEAIESQYQGELREVQSRINQEAEENATIYLLGILTDA